MVVEVVVVEQGCYYLVCFGQEEPVVEVLYAKEQICLMVLSKEAGEVEQKLALYLEEVDD